MSREVIAEEQRELDAMYIRLDEMRIDAQQRKKDAAFSSDGTPAGRFTRDALQYRYAEEVAALCAVESVSDEYLQAADVVPETGDLGAAGDSALLEALNAPRTGRMGDIIATIQAEQDRIIRSDRNGVMVVQGGPGTGKTVVATIGTLFPGVVAAAVDDGVVAELKGRPVMAKVIDHAVLQRQRMPRGTREVLFDRMPVRLENSLLVKAQR